MIAGRVIMLSRDQGLASIAGQLVGRGQPLTRFSSPADVPDWLRPPTGVVVLDYPKTARAVVYRQLRQRYQGPVLALLDPDEDASGLPTDHGRIDTLHRPFTGEELSASLDALAGSRNGARRSKSRSLTAPPLGDDADTTAPLDVSVVFAATPARLRARHEASGAAAAVPPAIAWVPLATPTAGGGGAAPRAGAAQAVVGVPAARVAVRRVGAARRRGLWSRHMGPAARQRVNGLVLILAATAALIVGVTLSDGGRCRSTGCRNVAGAAESGGAGIPPSSTTPQPGGQPAAGSGKGGASKGSGVAAAPPGPSLVIPIASGVGDLISGTSSSSGGAPLLVVAPGSTGGTGSTGGGTGGGTPTPTTQPTATTSPVTTLPPPTTTAPPATTSPPTTTQPPTTTEPPTTTQPPTTTEPPTTTSEPPTTQAPTTTEPATTAPATTAAATTDTTA